MKNEKVVVVSYILYYIISFALYFYLFATNILYGVILEFQSIRLWLFLIIIIPLILMTLPFIINKYLNKNYMISLLISIIVSLLYLLVVVPVIKYGITIYAKDFNVEKWQEKKTLRYLMVDSLEETHKLIGMNENELIELLGEFDYKKEDNICYFIRNDLGYHYLCFKFDNSVVVDTFEEIK